jgi:hypothetical protein
LKSSRGEQHTHFQGRTGHAGESLVAYFRDCFEDTARDDEPDMMISRAIDLLRTGRPPRRSAMAIAGDVTRSSREKRRRFAEVSAFGLRK